MHPNTHEVELGGLACSENVQAVIERLDCAGDLPAPNSPAPLQRASRAALTFTAMFPARTDSATAKASMKQARASGIRLAALCSMPISSRHRAKCPGISIARQRRMASSRYRLDFRAATGTLVTTNPKFLRRTGKGGLFGEVTI